MIHPRLLDYLGYNLVLSQWLPQSVLLKLDMIEFMKFCNKYGNLRKQKLEKLKKKTRGKGRPTFRLPPMSYDDKSMFDVLGFMKYMEDTYNIEVGGTYRSIWWIKPYYD